MSADTTFFPNPHTIQDGVRNKAAKPARIVLPITPPARRSPAERAYHRALRMAEMAAWKAAGGDVETTFFRKTAQDA